MSLWDPFIADYERRWKDLLKQIELMEARVKHTEKSDLGRWITTTAESLKHAKADLEEIERLLKEAKTKL
jgi:primosomal protein N''